MHEIRHLGWGIRIHSYYSNAYSIVCCTVCSVTTPVSGLSRDHIGRSSIQLSRPPPFTSALQHLDHPGTTNGAGDIILGSRSFSSCRLVNKTTGRLDRSSDSQIVLPSWWSQHNADGFRSKVVRILKSLLNRLKRSYLYLFNIPSHTPYKH